MRTVLSAVVTVFLASPLWAQTVVPGKVPPAALQGICADINQMKALGQSDNAILDSLRQKWSPPNGRRNNGFKNAGSFKNNRPNRNRLNRIGNGNRGNLARLTGNQVNGDNSSVKQRDRKKAGRKVGKRQKRLNRLNNPNGRQGQAGRRRQNNGSSRAIDEKDRVPGRANVILGGRFPRKRRTW